MTLVAILHSPPTTTGARTLARLRLASEILGFEQVRVLNLLRTPTPSVRTASQAGAVGSAWLNREEVDVALADAEAALLAYGLHRPSGVAGEYFDQTIDAVNSALSRRAMPVWTLGGTPRHPSRWQRYTSRVLSDLAFPDAVRVALQVQRPS